MRTFLKKTCIAALILVAAGGFLFAANNIVFQQMYPVSSVNGVRIDLMSEEVEIALWNRNDFRVTVVSSYDEYPTAYLSNGILSINENTGGSRHRCTVEIKVPESFYAKAAYGGWDISTMSGSVNASKLWGEAVSVETMSGSIRLSKCEMQMASLSSSSGSIVLTQCIVSSIGNFESTSGSITFDGIAAGINAESTTGAINVSLDQPVTQDCNLESTTGAILITMPDNPGFKLVFDSRTGSVYNAFTGYSGSKSGIDNYGAGYVIIRAESGTGSIRVLKK